MFLSGSQSITHDGYKRKTKTQSLEGNGVCVILSGFENWDSGMSFAKWYFPRKQIQRAVLKDVLLKERIQGQMLQGQAVKGSGFLALGLEQRCKMSQLVLAHSFSNGT